MWFFRQDSADTPGVRCEQFRRGRRYADQGVYENLQYYANWPTFPQLYVKGELVGGADIVSDMHQQGELQKLLDSATG